MAWQGTLAQMKQHGTKVYQTCTARDCEWWFIHNIDFLIMTYGPDYMLWDKFPPCLRCGGGSHFMAAPGDSTPYRPLMTSVAAAEHRRRWLRSFGFTRRDQARIKAMAETVTSNCGAASLNDLDVPFRVGACLHQDVGRSTGKILGEWAGRTLLYWPMVGMERDHWAARRPGPRKVP